MLREIRVRMLSPLKKREKNENGQIKNLTFIKKYDK